MCGHGLTVSLGLQLTCHVLLCYVQAALKAFEKDVASDLTLTVRDSSYQIALLRQKKKEWEEEEKEKQAAKDRREAAMISSAIARAHAALPQVGEKKSMSSKEERKPPPPPNPWSALTSPEGHTYYYNAITGGEAERMHM